MPAPILYAFHPLNGEYLGTAQADPSPLEVDVWLEPAHTTKTKPPAVLAGHTTTWDGAIWTIVPDHRGETWYEADGTPVVITELGDPAAPPSSLLAAAPPPTEWWEDKTRDQVAAEGLGRAIGEGSGQDERILSLYPKGEPDSWPKQSIEARRVIDENDRILTLDPLAIIADAQLAAVLDAPAILPDLAVDREEALIDLANKVKSKETTYQAVMRAVSKLRVHAERAPAKPDPLDPLALAFPTEAALAAEIDRLIADCIAAVDAILAPPPA